MRIENAKTREVTDALKAKSSLVRRSSSFSDENRTEIVYLPLEQLKPYRNQARRIFDQGEIEKLADTIRDHGIRNPLTVLRIDDADPVVFEVVSGERRLRAARIADLRKVPCIIIDNAQQAEEIALIENIQRQDLHPVELARSLHNLLDSRGWGVQTEISKRLGIATSKISELLSLMELSEVVQEHIIAKNFRGRENLRKLLKIPNESLQIAFIDDVSLPVAKQKTPDYQPARKSGSRSVLRISLEDNELRFQKTGTRSLSPHQREELVRLLKQIAIEVWDEHVINP